MPAIKTPKLAFWNAQGITNKTTQTQLEHFAIKERIDILLIAETFLKPQHSFVLNNYIVYRNDRLNQAHGGVALAVNKSIAHKYCSSFNTKFIENIAIEITIKNTPTLIVAAYSPKYSKDFEHDIQLMSSSTTQYMIFGDFNAKHYSWNCSKTNKAGNLLYTLQQSNSFMIYHTAEHTHHPHSGQTPSTIDLVLSNVNFFYEISSYAGHLSSDHNPIVCEIDEIIQQTQKKIYDYSKANWNEFRRCINNSIQALQTPETNVDIDDSIEKFTKIILDAQTHNIPTKSQNIRSAISTETKQLIQTKNALKRRWQRTHIEPDKSILKTELNRLQKQINRQTASDSNNFWNKNLRNMSKSNKKLWNLSKQLRGKCDSVVNKIKIQGRHLSNDKDKANCLAEIFEEAHSITSEYTNANDTNVSATIHAFNVFNARSQPTTNVAVDEIQSIIKSLKPFKSPGPDSIQNVLLKNLPQSAIVWLTTTINKCIELSFWPSSFKIAKVIPILKGGKPQSNPRSYRPISLLNAIGKILEKIIYQRLINIIEDKQLLPNYQFGFRRGHSTTHQAARIKKHIRQNKRDKKSTGMILLDIEKAFDSIWHDGLIFKLIKMKLPSYLVKMINAFIRNRKLSVHVNNSISKQINIPAGLAQGTCISPILYALFVADMPIVDKTDAALYADDTAIYTSAKQSKTIINRLNQSFITLQKYFDQWKIKINATKTQAIIFPFDNKRKRIPTTPLKNGQHTIKLSKSVKYLGVTFDSKLNFGEHITNTIDKANKCFRALYPMLASSSQLSTTNKSLIYTSVIRPILTYGCPVWSSAATVHMKKFTVIQNKILKTIFNLHRRTPTVFMKEITGIDSFHQIIHTLNVNFINNCQISDFNLIREIDLM